MSYPESQWRKALRERLVRQAEPTPNTEAWTLMACRDLCALMAEAGDPIDAVVHEGLHSVTVRRGPASFVLTATRAGWRSYPMHPDLEQPLDMTVRLAKRLRALLPNEEDGEP